MSKNLKNKNNIKKIQILGPWAKMGSPRGPGGHFAIFANFVIFQEMIFGPFWGLFGGLWDSTGSPWKPRCLNWATLCRKFEHFGQVF